MHSSSSSTDGFNQVPISLEDPDYKGLELDVFCEKHEKAAKRLVAFEGIYTRRRKVEDRVVDLSYLQANLTYQQQCRKELLDDMKAEMAAEIAKKDADTQKLNEKYELLCNLTSAQATVI
ncbi:hypothetical protein D1007_43777 [Hordeum vulgare]|nr:hypothetical protein D1007_43777 [Hordeum vulgare]